MTCNVGTQKLTVFYDPTSEPLITVPLERTRSRLVIRSEDNRQGVTGLNAVGIIKLTRSNFAVIHRWVVDGVVTEAEYLELDRIFGYQITEPGTLLRLRDEAHYLPDWKAAAVPTRTLVSGSTVATGGRSRSYYDYTAYMNARENPWATPIGNGDWEVKLEFIERLA